MTIKAQSHACKEVQQARFKSVIKSNLSEGLNTYRKDNWFKYEVTKHALGPVSSGQSLDNF